MVFLLWVAVHACLFINEPWPKASGESKSEFPNQCWMYRFLSLYIHNNGICILSGNIHVYKSYLYMYSSLFGDFFGFLYRLNIPLQWRPRLGGEKKKHWFSKLKEKNMMHWYQIESYLFCLFSNYPLSHAHPVTLSTKWNEGFINIC